MPFDYTPAALDLMRSAIAGASGREVFFRAMVDDQRQIVGAEVLARGNRSAVPALLHSCRYGDVVIHNHPSGNLEPSTADLEIAASLGALGVGFHIVDNLVESVYRVVEAFAPETLRQVTGEQITAHLGPDGSVARALPDYEDRPEQLQMAEVVAEAFNHDRIAVIEAGTGTGKSLAYLIPALLWATTNRERVIVATRTINLQEQLIRKDLPFLRRSTGLEVQAVLVKGRSNYLCRRRTEAAGAELGLFDQRQTAELAELRRWAAQSVQGDREELPVPPEEDLWEEVRCEIDQCARARCPFFTDCFFYRARRQAASADILVVNHALLLADLALRHSTDNYTAAAVLPPCDRLILDEAHHLEDVATRSFSARTTRFSIARLLGRLRHPRKTDRGLLPRLLHQLGEHLPQGQDDLYHRMHSRIEELTSGRQQLLDTATSVLDDLGLRLPDQLPAARPRAEREDLRLRIVPEVRTTPFWQETVSSVGQLTKQVSTLAAGLDSLLALGEAIPENAAGPFLSLFTDLNGLALRLHAVAADLTRFVAEDADSCTWVEVRTGSSGQHAALCVAPLAVDKLLFETLFERSRTVVLTSATLSVATNFNYLKQRLGLSAVPKGRLHELLLTSPFDYRRQALLAAPDDLPTPDHRDYPRMLSQRIEEAIIAADGRSFVLFTANSLLQRIHAELAPVLQARGYRCLRQGEMSRHRLLQAFRDDVRSVLFGTDSFWEGVDVPGRALEQVIIARLPFKVPSEPVLEARAEAIERAGGDPFMSYTVPQAVIRFKQGFGRLIRHRNDRGVVLILDVRVIRRNYGRTFLRSLPDVPLLTAPADTVMETLRQFFAETAQNAESGDKPVDK